MEGLFSRLFLKVIMWLMIIFGFSISVAEAQETYEYFTGVRSLGMGGAQVAIVNDETALLANPAALGRLRNFFITVVDPELEIGTQTQGIIGADITAFMDPQDTLDKLNDPVANQTKKLHERIQIFPSFVTPNFGIGIFSSYRTDAELDATQTNMILNYRNDFAAVVGFNLRLWDGRIKLGANARINNRIEIDRNDIPVGSTGLTVESLAKEGLGIGSDVGLILSAPWAWLPTLAAVYRDAGNTHYNLGDGMFHDTAERPDSTPATLDAGFSLSPILGKRNRMVISAEMRDIQTEDPLDEPSRRIYGGVEFNFSDFFFLRGGMHQGYWTAGLEIAMFNWQLQFAAYGEEVGDLTLAEEEEERRYVGKFSYRF